MNTAARSLRFHPEAERDAEGARAWYAERSAIAARAFLTELIVSMEAVREGPERWPRYLSGTRRHHFPRFPFSLIYSVSDEVVTVVAVAHHRRRPGYWLERHRMTS
jgi:plasmid stabilization system protein ParE